MKETHFSESCSELKTPEHESEAKLQSSNSDLRNIANPRGRKGNWEGLGFARGKKVRNKEGIHEFLKRKKLKFDKFLVRPYSKIGIKFQKGRRFGETKREKKAREVDDENGGFGFTFYRDFTKLGGRIWAFWWAWNMDGPSAERVRMIYYYIFVNDITTLALSNAFFFFLFFFFFLCGKLALSNVKIPTIMCITRRGECPPAILICGGPSCYL